MFRPLSIIQTVQREELTRGSSALAWTYLALAIAVLELARSSAVFFAHAGRDMTMELTDWCSHTSFALLQCNATSQPRRAPQLACSPPGAPYWGSLPIQVWDVSFATGRPSPYLPSGGLLCAPHGDGFSRGPGPPHSLLHCEPGSCPCDWCCCSWPRDTQQTRPPVHVSWKVYIFPATNFVRVG